VAAEAREGARRALASILDVNAPAVPIFIRVSPVGTDHFEADLAVVTSRPGLGIVLPKCAGADDVHGLVHAWTTRTSEPLAVLPIAETSSGVLAAAGIVRADAAVIGLAFGAEDLAAEVGFARTAGGDEILLARSMVVLGAAAGRRWAIDSPNLELRRPELVLDDARRASALGFAGKFVIHPAQVALVHEAFRPSTVEVVRAESIVEAAARLDASGRGVGSVDGRMIDAPIVEAARRVLARERRYPSRGGAL
jgi:citrate lyase subunit beta/citryl-CoA lyase